jgi:hypothetical protein
MKALLIVLIVFSTQISYSQNEKSDYLIRFFEKPDSTIGVNEMGDKCGYKDVKGDTLIPLGKYYFCYTDTFRTYAIVLTNDGKCIAIDRNFNELYKVFWFDSGPDDSSDSLFRIVKNGKMGFADSATGKIMIPPVFNFVSPFVKGLAGYNEGGILKKDTVIEGHYIDGGKWGVINKKGEIIIKAQYDGGWIDEDTGEIVAIIHDKKYIVDRQGNVLREW